MGTWGHGILQNDTAQDGLCEVLHWIADGILKLEKKRPSEKNAARLGAAVGLLLHLNAGYWFNPEHDFQARLLAILERHRSAFRHLPAGPARLLEEVRQGKGEELVNRDGPPNPALSAILFARDVPGFSMQRTFGRREPALFEHAEAARSVQEIADRCVACIDEEFDDDEMVGDLCREASCMGAFGVLLEIEPCRVDPDKFASWRARYRDVRWEPSADEADFFARYDTCIEAAFRYGIEKFAAS
jgi:hypothetical protein